MVCLAKSNADTVPIPICSLGLKKRMCDLLIKNGHVVDPARETNEIEDVAISNGRIFKTGRGLDVSASEIIDANGCIVSPGLIDLHTHVYWGGTSIGVDADMVAQRSGCTTMVDAGTAGAGNMLGMKHHIVDRSNTRVLAFINISFPGIFAFSNEVMVGECSDLRLLNSRECVRAAKEHSELVVGVKVRTGLIAGGSNGIMPLDIAMEVAEELELPLMAHLDFPPPGRRDVLSRLRRGDILTHCFRPFPNAPVHGSGQIFDEIVEAREKGIIFDIGHGMGSFGFDTAEAMLANGFFPDVISSDVHALCVDGPAFDLLETMSKLLSLGMPVEEIIRSVTVAPAKAIGRDDLGTLREGSAADVTILRIEEGEYRYEDVLGKTMTGKKRFALERMISTN